MLMCHASESTRIINYLKATPEQAMALLPPFLGNFPEGKFSSDSIEHNLPSSFLFPAMSLWQMGK